MVQIDTLQVDEVIGGGWMIVVVFRLLFVILANFNFNQYLINIEFIELSSALSPTIHSNFQKHRHNYVFDL